MSSSNVKLTVNFNADDIIAKLETDSNLRAISEEARKLMDEYVPFDKGILAATSYSGVGTVTYPQIYAESNFYQNKNFNTEYHKKATMRWDLAAFGASLDGPEADKLIEAAENIYKRSLK